MESSEGIHMEYVAVFVAFVFPGALVAFNDDIMQALPCFTALRVYCAGIWHNAVVSLHGFSLFTGEVNVLVKTNVNWIRILPLVLCGLRVGITTPALDLVSILHTWRKPHGTSLTTSIELSH